MHRNVVAEINTDAIAHNVALLRERTGARVRICAAIKANAYGHGVHVVAPVLQASGVDMAAVATIGEAVELRELGWTRPILCFGPVFAAPSPAERADRIETVIRYDLTVTIVDGYGARDLNAAAARQGKRVRVHIKVDTGMGRMGVSPETAFGLAEYVASLPHLHLEGLYTHLACAEERDKSFARSQLETFSALLSRLRQAGRAIELAHAANTAAILDLPESYLDMVRPGLGLYGYLPGEQIHNKLALRPALRLCSHLVMVKRVPAGHSVGYGRTFVTQRESVLGVVPVGYNDGYPRRLSNRAVMGLAGGDAPVVGRISMDQTVIDLTDLPGAKVGDRVVIIDDRRERPNSVESLARLLGTIPYEITCLLGNRVQRVAVCDATQQAIPAPNSPAGRA